MSALSRMRDTAAREAATWIDRLATDCSAECRVQFRQWLKQSPINQDQFLVVSGFRRQLRYLPFLPARQVRETHVWPRVAAVALAVGLVGGLAWLLSSRTTVTSEPVHATTFTALEDPSMPIRLDDGSTLHLNGGRARMSISNRFRELRVYEGEAKVAVVSDSKRQFRLINGPFVIEDVGTEFVATPRHSGIRVLVIYGSVRLTVNCRSGAPAGRKTQVLLLRQWQEVSVEDDRCMTVWPPKTLDQHQIDQRIAWTVGWFHFHNDRLADAAERFNRYNAVQIKVDPAIAGRRIFGDFAATNPTKFARTAEALLGVRITPVATDSVKTDVLYLADSHSKSGGPN